MLDLLGMVPGVGALADLANGFWYMSEGDYFSAASSFVSSVPGLGDIAGGIAKAITGCTKYAKAFKFATRLASNIGNFALGAYQTATQIYGLWDKYVTQGKPWGEESLGEFLGAAFTGISTVFSAKGVADDIANYKNTKHDILTSQCFVEGTLVVTKDGDKPIEEIKAGDLVYSTDPETGESEYKEVVRTFRKETDVLIHIFVNDDEIETTPVHPFWVDGEWVAAKDLREGDELTLADGSTTTITKTYGEQLDEPVIVYNFEVSDFHTYYVTDNGVLVHNANSSEYGANSTKPKTDFYVTPDGDVFPATGYRYMDSKYAQQTIDSMSAPGSYFGFEKFDSAKQAQNAFQVSPNWSDCKLRGEFDTLQVMGEAYVPREYGDTGIALEPFTRCYPEYGKGGVQQYIYRGTIHFKNVQIIGD